MHLARGCHFLFRKENTITFTYALYSEKDLLTPCFTFYCLDLLQCHFHRLHQQTLLMLLKSRICKEVIFHVLLLLEIAAGIPLYCHDSNRKTGFFTVGRQLESKTSDIANSKKQKKKRVFCINGSKSHKKQCCGLSDFATGFLATGIEKQKTASHPPKTCHSATKTNASP